MKQIHYLLMLVLMAGISSCGLLGFHVEVHNPKHSGSYARVSNEIKMLGAPNKLRTGYDVNFYGLDIAINAQNHSLSGWVEIRGTALLAMDSLQFDLDKNLRVDEIRWGSRDGEDLNYNRIFSAVQFACPQTLMANAHFSLHVRYHGKPIVARKPPWDGGTVWKKDKLGNNWLGVACESEGASIWFPCKDLTSDEADSATMRFSIPDNGLLAISNGTLEHEELVNGFHSFTWRVHYPINTYNITYYVGNFVKVEDHYVGIYGDSLTLNHYVLRPNEGIAREHFQKVKEHIRTYESYYGAYAFYKDGFKLIEAPYAGMEHQSAIAYGSKFTNDLYGEEDYIMLHETGHEWFGNAVSVSDLADVWLQEGITTYGEALYFEKQYTTRLALRHILFQRYMIRNKVPMVGPRNQRYFNYKDGDVYTKGAWTLHTLRHVINNDDLFFKILRTFYEENKLKITDSEHFIATVNKITGKDYDWFFKQYLYTAKAPFIEYQLTDSTLYYRWVDTDSSFTKMPITFFVGEGKYMYDVVPTAEVKKITLPNNYMKDIQFDNIHALFGFRTNKKLIKIYRTQ